MTDILHFFPGQGFRPAIYLNDFIGPRLDCPRLVPAPDADISYSAKFDPFGHIPATGYAWGTWIPASPATLTAADLADPFTAGPLIPGPWWPPVDYPCNCITHPPVNPPLPEPAPVPLPASSICLLAGLAALALLRRRK